MEGGGVGIGRGRRFCHRVARKANVRLEDRRGKVF